MSIIKTRFWLSILAGIAFIAPLGAVIAVEHAKNSAKLAAQASEYAGNLSSNDQARSAYYQNIEVKKADLQKSMSDAQAEYNALLQKQPEAKAAHTTQTQQTTMVPVTVKKQVSPSSGSSSSTSSSKPSSSRSTKTS